jgi:phosphoribosylamine--glycine ligase
MKKVMVVDRGGRGNAIAYCFSKSPKVSNVFVAPGNAGSSLLEKCQQVPLESIDDIIDFVQKNEIDLTFVGPEGYLSKGIVNKFSEKGLRIIGPTKEATILESSKCDTKDFLHQIGVPIPQYKNFDDPEEAKTYVKDFYKQNPGENVVVKVDGLAEGKGSLVCNSLDNALYAIDHIMVHKAFGDAGNRVVIEKRLYGQELMFFVITDGKTVLPIESAMDYKAAFDNDDDARIVKYFGGINPRTGGLGGYSPHPWLDEELKQKIMNKIAIPTITKFKELKGIEYKGILYFGLMICEENGEKNPFVLEINVRMGDPEAEVVLPRLITDFYDISKAILENRLNEITLTWDSTYYLGLCAISGKIIRPFGVSRGEEYDEKKNIGYPGPHITNQPIRGLREVDPSCFVFHNGTAFKPKDIKDPSSIDPSKRDEDDNLSTTGGRVLTLVSRGNTLQEARDKGYTEIEKIFFPGMRYRFDIGKS